MHRGTRPRLLLTLALAAFSAAACARVVAPVTIILSPDTATVLTGDSVQLTATVENSTSQAVLWTSTDTTVATVSSDGLVMGLTSGAALIVATTPSGGASAVAQINVVCLGMCGSHDFQPSITIGSLTQTATGAPVDPAAVAGSIDVPLIHADTATQAVQARLFLDSATICTVLIQRNASCTLNTAAFDSTSGTVNFPNGPHTLLAEVYDETGQLAETAQITITLVNADTLLLSAVGAGTITDSTGLTWQTGDLTTTTLPVFYSGAAADSARFTLTAKDSSGATTTVTGVDHQPSDGLSFTFSASATPAQGGSSGLKDPAATVSATVFKADGTSVTRTTASFPYNAGG